MNTLRFTVWHSLFRISIGVFASSALLLTGCSTQNIQQPPKAVAVMTLQGSGVNLFQCATDEKGPYWRFVAPQLELKNRKNITQVSQGAEFTFIAQDGSKLRAKIIQSMPSKKTPNVYDVLFETGSYGRTGLLTGIEYVKRTNSTDGIPLTACSPAQLGQTLKVPFKATFTFYR